MVTTEWTSMCNTVTMKLYLKTIAVVLLVVLQFNCRYVLATEEPGLRKWSSWSACSQTCGEGVRTRARPCHGSECSAHHLRQGVLQSAPCRQEACPGQWEEWGAWGDCSVTCGSGSRVRTRVCSTRECEGSDTDTGQCSFAPCPDKGTTETKNHIINTLDGRNNRPASYRNNRPASYSKTTPQKSRGHSKHHHRRQIKRGAGLAGAHQGMTSSVTRESSDHKNLESLLTKMKTYVDHYREKQLGGDSEEWSTWGSWGACSKTCGTGTAVRIRTCSGGKCQGTSELAQQKCHLADCDVSTTPPPQPVTTEVPCEGTFCEQKRMFKYLKKEVKELLAEDKKLLQTSKLSVYELPLILGGSVILILGIISLCIIRCVDRKMEENRRVKRENKRKQQVGLPSTSKSFTSSLK